MDVVTQAEKPHLLGLGEQSFAQVTQALPACLPINYLALHPPTLKFTY